MQWKHPHLGEDLWLRTMEPHGTVWRKRQEAGATKMGRHLILPLIFTADPWGALSPCLQDHTKGQGGKVAEDEWASDVLQEHPVTLRLWHSKNSLLPMKTVVDHSCLLQKCVECTLNDRLCPAVRVGVLVFFLIFWGTHLVSVPQMSKWTGAFLQIPVIQLRQFLSVPSLLHAYHEWELNFVKCSWVATDTIV